ncbi:MAG: hypothetical protein LAO05_12305 [Acidobacteriia bacterium]|nr:hypothetical protein [Terriglobia bacterium]
MTRRSSAKLVEDFEAVAASDAADVFVGSAPRGTSAGVREDVFLPPTPRPGIVRAGERTGPAPAAKQARERARAPRSVLILALLVTIAVAAALLVGLDGWTYYRTPLGVRGFTPAHKILRPSGQIGLALGIGGTVLMILMQAYSLRKKLKILRNVGSVPRWLDFHIFCGILGPVLITFHTSFKFNGIVSVAYWSMLLVLVSGFVGRYLYVRIPKSIRGQELSVAQVEERAAALKAELLGMRLPTHLVEEVEAFEARVVPQRDLEPRWGGLLFGELYIRFSLTTLRRRIRHDGVGARTLHDVIALTVERALLLRRLAYLKRTKKLFELWHIFHRPLAYVMLAIVVVHVATAIYFGYAFGHG